MKIVKKQTIDDMLKIKTFCFSSGDKNAASKNNSTKSLYLFFYQKISNKHKNPCIFTVYFSNGKNSYADGQ